MQEKLENQDDVSRNHRYRRIQMQLCKDLDPFVHSQGYVKKVTIVMDSIWFDRKYDLIYELIWLFTKKYSPFVISNFLLISGSPMFIQGKTSKHDQTYMLRLQTDQQKNVASPQYGRIFLRPLISTKLPQLSRNIAKLYYWCFFLIHSGQKCFIQVVFGWKPG